MKSERRKRGISRLWASFTRTTIGVNSRDMLRTSVTGVIPLSLTGATGPVLFSTFPAFSKIPNRVRHYVDLVSVLIEKTAMTRMPSTILRLNLC